MGFDILQGKILISNIVENSKMQLFEMEGKSISTLSEMTKIESIILLELTSKELKKKKTSISCILLNDNFLNLSTTKKKTEIRFFNLFYFQDGIVKKLSILCNFITLILGTKKLTVSPT